MTREIAYLSALPSALIAADKNLIVTYMNHAAEALFETSATHAVGKSVLELLPLTKEEQAILDRVFSSSEEVTLHERALPLGYERYFKVTLHITPVGEGNVEQALFTIEKPTGLHAQTASEWKKETTRASGIMAAMMAHEVKNPLSGIRGAAQLLMEDLPKEQKPLLDLICTETDRIRDLLDQVDIFSAGAPPLSPVNIHEVLQYVISVAGAGVAKKINIKENYDPSLPEVHGHRDLLVQLFLNLVKNSAEAMKGQPDAKIIITTTYKSGYRIRLAGSSAPVALPIMVSIADNGPGLPEHMREHLFEPFISSKEEGRGLGLAVVAKIASDLGSVVELDVETKQGARFNVMLPVISSVESKS